MTRGHPAASVLQPRTCDSVLVSIDRTFCSAHRKTPVQMMCPLHGDLHHSISHRLRMHRSWDPKCSEGSVPASKSIWDRDTGGECPVLSSSSGSSAGTATKPPEPHGRNSAPDSSSSVMAASTRFVTCARCSRARVTCLCQAASVHQVHVSCRMISAAGSARPARNSQSAWCVSNKFLRLRARQRWCDEVHKRERTSVRGSCESSALVS